MNTPLPRPCRLAAWASPLKPLLLPMVAALLVALPPASADASVVTSAVGATAPPANGPHTADHLIDQSGLSVGYTSGVTELGAYLAAAPLHAATGVNGWLGFIGDASPTLRLDLGATHELQAVLMWAGDLVPWAFVDIATSIDGVGFSVQLDDVPATPPLGLGVDTPAQLITLDAAVQARYVELRLTCAPNPGACSMGEVAFATRGATVPLPATAGLLLVPLLTLAARRRDGRAARTLSPCRGRTGCAASRAACPTAGPAR